MRLLAFEVKHGQLALRLFNLRAAALFRHVSVPRAGTEPGWQRSGAGGGRGSPGLGLCRNRRKDTGNGSGGFCLHCDIHDPFEVLAPLLPGEWLLLVFTTILWRGRRRPLWSGVSLNPLKCIERETPHPIRILRIWASSLKSREFFPQGSGQAWSGSCSSNIKARSWSRVSQ